MESAAGRTMPPCDNEGCLFIKTLKKILYWTYFVQYVFVATVFEENFTKLTTQVALVMCMNCCISLCGPFELGLFFDCYLKSFVLGMFLNSGWDIGGGEFEAPANRKNRIAEED